MQSTMIKIRSIGAMPPIYQLFFTVLRNVILMKPAYYKSLMFLVIRNFYEVIF